MCKCRTDSAAYHDPDDVMTPAEEAAQELERECQIESFINNWSLQTDGYIDALYEICEGYQMQIAFKASVSCAIKEGGMPSSDITTNSLRYAREYAETQIDNNNVWWDWS